MQSSQNEPDGGDDPRTTTRYATIVADPGPGGFYPKSREFLERADVTTERVHHVDVVDDLTVVGLYELHGDADRIRREVHGVPTAGVSP